jgi:hypothetical protein
VHESLQVATGNVDGEVPLFEFVSDFEDPVYEVFALLVVIIVTLRISN